MNIDSGMCGRTRNRELRTRNRETEEGPGVRGWKSSPCSTFNTLAPLLSLPVWAQRRGTPTRCLAPLLPLPVWAQRRGTPTRCLAPLLPLPVWAQRRGTPTRCLAPLLPLPVWAQRRCAPALPPAAGPGAAPLRPYTLSSHVQRATFNLQPLALRASRLAPLNGILPHIYATTCATV
jgi:hypothetical protein